MDRGSHRSRQKIPFINRHHLHDGLRFMTLEIPKKYGWHLPRTATQPLDAVTDDFEEKLYRAHENAHRMGERLQRAKTELWEEYERSGRIRNLDFDQFLETSSSIIAEVYKDRQQSTYQALDQMSLVLNSCKSGDERVVKEIGVLREQFDKRGLHCRRFSKDDWLNLDSKIKVLINDENLNSIVVPCRTAEEIVSLRKSLNDGSFGFLEDLVNNGASMLIAIDCAVDAVAVASSITRIQNPSLPSKLISGEVRTGLCLKALILVGNRLGWQGLHTIAQSLRCQGQLRVLHFDDNGAGETQPAAEKSTFVLSHALSALKALAAAIAESDVLTALSLCRNGIGPAGCAAIAEGLARSGTLTRLDLSDNPLGLAGAEQLAGALASNRSLTALVLTRTHIGPAGLTSVCSALVNNTSLEQLIALDCAGPSSAAAAAACIAKGGNHTLRTLHVLERAPWLNPNFAPPRAPPSRRADAARSWPLSEAGEGRASVTSPGNVDPDPAQTGSELGISFATSSPPDVARNLSTGMVLENQWSPAASLSGGCGSPSGGAEFSGIREKDALDMSVSAQLERTHDRERLAREATRGLNVLDSSSPSFFVDRGPHELVQASGPDLPLGRVMPTAAQIIGRRAGGVDKSRVPCEWCCIAARPAGVGTRGHEAFECPRRFYEETGECMPGFDSGGTKREALWDASQTNPLEAVAKEWEELRGLGFFSDTEATLPPPARRVPLLDVSRKGQPRRLWSERGAVSTPDWSQRQARFERLMGQAARSVRPAGSQHDRDQLRVASTGGRMSAASADARKGILSISGGLLGRNRGARSVVFVSEPAAPDLEMGPAGAGGSDLAAQPRPATIMEGYIPSAKRRTALLFQAVQQNRVDEVRAFLAQAHGPVDVDCTDRFGNTGLLIAVHNGYKRMTKLFIGAGAGIDRQNRSGNTALHYARGLGHTAIFDYLLGKGGDDTVVNDNGLTCYQYAVTAAEAGTTSS